MNQNDLLELHDSTCATCKAIMVKKNTDYCGGSNDPFANFRISAVFGIHPIMGIMLRVTDKLQRIRAYCTNGKMAVDTESVEDAADDIINYMILIKGLVQEGKESK